MSQAKVLTQSEIDQVLRYVSTTRYAKRNRLLVVTSFFSGMRVGEIASLKLSDVLNSDNTIKNEIRLSAQQTKGNHARTVFVNEKLRSEIASYITTLKVKDIQDPLFSSEKGGGFTANTLAQWFFWMYRKAGISGASSHSGRKSFLTALANRGISIHILASLAGHRSIAVTNRYLVANDEQKKQAVELI